MADARHSVHLYADLDEFAAGVAAYVHEAFAHGEPALLIVRPATRARIASRLGGEAHALLTWADADAMLAAILAEDGRPSTNRFERLVGGLFDDIAARHPGKTLRAVGEMVELLVERGDPDAAISLEELWNSLGWSRDFGLYCGYTRTRFDGGAQADVLAEIVRTHAHVTPAIAPV